MNLFRGLLASLALAATAPGAQTLPVVPGEPALVTGIEAPATLRLAAKAARARVELPPVTEREVASVREANRRQPAKRVVVGINRGLDPAALPSARLLAWQPVPAGRAAQLALTSPGAGALRIAIDLRGVPPAAEIVVYGSAPPGRPLGPFRVGEIADRMAPWWSPLTEGETQTIEFFLPHPHEPATLDLPVLAASHLFTTPSSGFTKRIADIGSAGACNVDVACSSLASTPAFENAVSSVAQMVFTDGNFTALCTGTLLNDTDAATQTPWFFTANHCFDNEASPYKTPAQMQAVANTLNTLWRFEARSCNSGTPESSWVQLSGGATLVKNDPQSDVLLLRLNNPAPGGAYFSGWDANPVPAGATVIGIHHPQGDLKKVSQGTVLGFTTPGIAGGTSQYIQTRWSSGTTEGGSSGSGIWTFDGSQYLLRGGLWGGSAMCTNMSATDVYSRFDQAYPGLSAFLTPRNAPIANFTDLWWNPAESGWGLNLTHHPSNVIFGVWYTYDSGGKPLWVVMPTGSWSSSTTYTGPLYITAGPAYTSGFDPSLVKREIVGTGTLSFSDADNGTWSYVINGASGTKAITRQSF